MAAVESALDSGEEPCALAGIYDRIPLSEANLPLSATFIDFLACRLDQQVSSGETWFDQRPETLSRALRIKRAKALSRLQRIVTHEVAQAAIDAVYGYFRELATGSGQRLAALHGAVDFIVVVGIPRNGGSYLTGEIYRALGEDPNCVPTAIAHDGMPDARPWSLTKRGNSGIRTLLSISEYLAMVGLYFQSRTTQGRIPVPKKMTKAVYEGGLFRRVLGPRARYLVTVRHPVACCISTYEKSGGLPVDGLFAQRSAMEKWIRRDVLAAGASPAEFVSMDYFSAYVRYWELYHMSIAMSGLLAGRACTIVPYGTAAMESTAATFHREFTSACDVSAFSTNDDLRNRHSEWMARGELAIERVSRVWDMVGLSFPTCQVLECW